MVRGYSRERTSVYSLHYHFIWCPKYRKPVLVDNVRQDLVDLINEKADEFDLDVINLAVQDDHVHLFIEGNPKLPPNKIIQQVKGYTSRILSERYDFGLPSLWTRSYFVSSTGSVSDEIIDQYIEEQTGV